MQSSTTGNFQKPSIDLRARHAFITSLVLAISLAVGVIAAILLGQATGTSQLFTISAIIAIATLLNITAIYFSRQKRVEAATALVVISIILVVPTITLLVSGLGTLLGLIGFIVIFIVATLTLVQPHLSWAIIAGLILGIGTILLETLYPFKRLESGSISIFIQAASILAVLFFAYFISRQFAAYPLRIKIIALLLIVTAIAISVVAAGINALTRNEITQQVGLNTQRQAERVASEIEKELESHIHVLQLQALFYESFARLENSRYGNLDTDEILQNIQTLDEEWINGSGDSFLISDVLNNATANRLRDFQSLSPEHIELFITDEFGANIAATNRTSDYYQADEDWWQTAYNNGEGAIYIGQPEYDESSQTFAVNIALPIFDNDRVSGILRSTLNIDSLLALLESERFGNTGKADIQIGATQLLGAEELPLSEANALNELAGGFGVVDFQGIPSLVSQVPLQGGDLTAPSEKAISQLGWNIIVHQGVSDAYSTAEEQVKTITLITLGVLALAAILGYFASQLIISPIVSLTNTANLISSGDLTERSKLSTNDEIGVLARTFNHMTSQLQDTLAGLERRVAERTADVELERLLSERRAQELRSISEISRAISTEHRLDTLLPLITRLVSERFDFYHVGIFFVDETRRFAFLQAANSAGGQNMLARGHRLDVGTGLVGTVAKTGKARIALDVGSDASFFDNPDLPNTRSEMALPLNIRGKTIGVLDVQSTKPGAFSESDANSLAILGDQVAIAIENARLLGYTQQARDEAETLYSQALRKEWSSFSRQTQSIGYRQTSTGGSLVERPVESNEIRRSLESGQVVVFDGKGTKSPASMAVPIKLRGQTIGVLNINAPTNDRKWSQDEVNLAQAISDRLALALENARLLQESQRRAAKEAKIGEVSTKISASINMRSVLETAVEALGRALPGSEVILQFEQTEEQE